MISQTQRSIDHASMNMVKTLIANKYCMMSILIKSSSSCNLRIIKQYIFIILLVNVKYNLQLDRVMESLHEQLWQTLRLKINEMNGIVVISRHNNCIRNIVKKSNKYFKA